MQRAGEPRLERRRERLLLADRGPLARGVQQIVQRARVLVGGQRPPENQRQRNDADAGDVGPLVEPRDAVAWRHRDPELVPQPLAAELHLLDGGAEHVLDEDQSRVRRDDEALGRDQTVRDVACIFVQQRDGRHQLPDQAERGVGVERQLSFARDPEQVRQPRALDVIRDDRQRVGVAAVDAADARVVAVPEVRQPRDPLAQRELERRHRRQRRVDPQQLYVLAGRRVGGEDAVTDAVREDRRFGAIWREERRHGVTAMCNGRTTTIVRKSLEMGASCIARFDLQPCQQNSKL